MRLKPIKKYGISCWLIKIPKYHLFLPRLRNVYENIISKAKEIILFGDLNIDMMCTENDLCDIYDIEHLRTVPTSFKKPEGTLSDPIIVRNPRRFKKSINVFCCYSDWHHIVQCISKLHVPPREPVKINYRSLKSFDENIFKQEVSRIPFIFLMPLVINIV